MSEKKHLKEDCKDYYVGQDKFYVGIDCIVFALCEGSVKLLLIKRDFEPHRGELSLMGGFVRNSESVDDAARRVLRDLTGLENIYMSQVGTFGEIDRDPGERVISVAYSALLNFSDIDHSTLESHNALWFDINEVPRLCFDHNLMVERALDIIKRRFRTEPLAFRLLPPCFTLTQLQKLYETVTGENIDKRNFRRRVLDHPSIEATEMIDKENSRRGARMYRYNPNRSHEQKFKV